MKRIVVLSTYLLLLLVATAQPVDSQRAIKAASTAVRLFTAEQTEGQKADIVENAQVDIADVTPQLGIGNLYAYNYTLSHPALGERYGFVVLSGDELAAPLLAISDEGPLDPAHVNPAARQHLLRYSWQIAAARQEGQQPTSAIRRKWHLLESGEALALACADEEKGDFYNDRIRQLLGNMRWGQSRPYNRFCPGTAITGCVATALGMIMNHWDYPEHGFGRHSYNGQDNPAAYPDWPYGQLSVDFQNTYYDWEHMGDYAITGGDQTTNDAIALLLYHIGVAMDMRYGPTASGCWSLAPYATYDTSLHLSPTVGAEYRIPRHFGYQYSYAGLRDSIGDDTLWMRMLYHSLAEGKPIYYAGWAADSSADGHSATSGHGYVIDGYFSDHVDSNMFHINWGWTGSENGYFKLDAMRPSSYDFTQWHGAIIGLQPDTSYHGYDPVAIRPVPASPLRMAVTAGSLTVQGAAGLSVALYDPMGRLVAQRARSQADAWTLPLRPGLYLVQAVGQPAQKVRVP